MQSFSTKRPHRQVSAEHSMRSSLVAAARPVAGRSGSCDEVYVIRFQVSSFWLQGLWFRKGVGRKVRIEGTKAEPVALKGKK